MTKKRIFLLLACIIGVELVGSLSGLLAGNIKGRYAELVQPPLAPPGPVFGIVWVILYFLMGISLFLLLTTETQIVERKKALVLFFAQLFFNFIWSIIFFGGEHMWLGALLCLFLDVLVFYSIVVFRRVRPLAAYLFIPYFLWICFATYLSFAIALLN